MRELQICNFNLWNVLY